MNEDSLRVIVSEWQKRLDLESWRITLKFHDKDADEGVEAMTSSAPHCDEATITFYNWTDWGGRKAAEIVVHELLHIAHRDVESVLDLLDGQLHRDVYGVIDTAFRHAVEVFVDKQARLLVALSGNVSAQK